MASRPAPNCGFGDADQMRAVFVRRLGVTPGEYRRQFRRASVLEAN